VSEADLDTPEPFEQVEVNGGVDSDASGTNPVVGTGSGDARAAVVVDVTAGSVSPTNGRT
jgi:hypothetical protein